jgi:hypothetical protein
LEKIIRHHKIQSRPDAVGNTKPENTMLFSRRTLRTSPTVSTVRLIPRLDIKGPNLIKGIHLEGLRVVGDPNEFARIYYEAWADELFKYLSIPEEEFAVASKMFEQPIMNREYFDALCDGFRSPHLWKYENQEWSLRHPVWRDAP